MGSKKNYLIDMDGVLVHGQKMIPGAGEFIDRIRSAGCEFLLLTNNPAYTARDLAHRLEQIGLTIPPERIFTSAMATARFLRSQTEGARVFVIGESGLTTAIHDEGMVITDIDPQYVVLGETSAFNYDLITKAIRFILDGASFIATNPDPTGVSDNGIVPANGAMAALIERAAGVTPFYVGKPNPLMMRTALNYLGVHSENTVMIGDRMDTDILAGVESGLETILVLTGVTTRDMIEHFPYRPSRVMESVAAIVVE